MVFKVGMCGHGGPLVLPDDDDHDHPDALLIATHNIEMSECTMCTLLTLISAICAMKAHNAYGALVPPFTNNDNFIDQQNKCVQH